MSTEPTKFQDLLRQLEFEFCQLYARKQQLCSEQKRLLGHLGCQGEQLTPEQDERSKTNQTGGSDSSFNSFETGQMCASEVQSMNGEDGHEAIPKPPRGTPPVDVSEAWKESNGARNRSLPPTSFSSERSTFRDRKQVTKVAPIMENGLEVGIVPVIAHTKTQQLKVNKVLERSGITTKPGDSCLLHPNKSKFLTYWDMVVMAALSYVAVVAPVQVAILQTQSIGIMFVINCMIDLIFLLDMILQFFTMYPKQSNFGESWEHRPRKIAVNYLKTWFLIDFISIIPFDLVSIIAQSEVLQRVKVVKIVRLLRLLKLVRIFRAIRIFKHFELHMSITYGKLALIKFFCMLMIIAHWLASLWCLSLTLVDEEDGIRRWIDDITEREIESNIIDKTIDTPWKLYLVSLYFTSYTITSVGYGDIGPQNMVEIIICMFMILASGVSWAILLGQVCGVLAGLGQEEAEFRSMMDGLNRMMRDRLLPDVMRLRLRSFFISSKLQTRRARQIDLIAHMSPGLQGEVVMYLNKKWMKQVKFFRRIMEDAGKSPGRLTDFIVDVSMRFQTVNYAQCEHFGQPHTLYVLLCGLSSGRGRVNRTGSVWGDDFMLADINLTLPCESNALTYVELIRLTREDFYEVVDLHAVQMPELRKRVRRYCCWLALQRWILREAQEKMFNKKTSCTFSELLG